MDAVVKIPATSMSRLQEEINALNKKAAKLGLEPITMTVIGEENVRISVELGFDYDKIYKTVKIQGESPKLNGWTLLAVKTPQESGENLIKTVPGEEVPARFREIGTFCEHCNSHRRRKDVFILRSEEGKYKQVGRNCLADFLGHVSPETLISQAQVGWDFLQLSQDIHEEGWDGGSNRPFVDVECFVTTCSIVIRRMGWVSRSQCAFNQRPTADLAWELCVSPAEQTREMVREFDLHAQDRDIQLAKSALEWARGLSPTHHEQYLYNLGVAARNEIVKKDTAGLLGSLIVSYKRYNEAKQEKKTGSHVGVLNKRQNFNDLTVVSVRSFEGSYGVKNICTFEDADGNTLIWWTSANIDWLEEGKKVNVVATVHKHEVYKNINQTVLQRLVKC